MLNEQSRIKKKTLGPELRCNVLRFVGFSFGYVQFRSADDAKKVLSMSPEELNLDDR